MAQRWALDDISLPSGRSIREGDKVVIDLISVNRDTSVFGDNAEDFDPLRETPDGVSPYGLSFGLAMHACIGQDMAAGLPERLGADPDDPLFGLVPIAVQYLFDHGAVPDPDDPAEMDASTSRPYFGRYPIIFERSP